MLFNDGLQKNVLPSVLLESCRLQRGLGPRSRIEGLDDPRVTLDSRGLLVEGRGFKNVHYLATIFKTSILLVSENYTFRTSRHQTLTLI